MKNNKMSVEQANKLAAPNTMKELTVEETLNKGYKVFTRCPRCNTEIEVNRASDEHYSYVAKCKKCKMVFGYDLAKGEDRTVITII